MSGRWRGGEVARKAPAAPSSPQQPPAITTTPPPRKPPPAAAHGPPGERAAAPGRNSRSTWPCSARPSGSLASPSMAAMRIRHVASWSAWAGGGGRGCGVRVLGCWGAGVLGCWGAGVGVVVRVRGVQDQGRLQQACMPVHRAVLQHGRQAPAPGGCVRAQTPAGWAAGTARRRAPGCPCCPPPAWAAASRLLREVARGWAGVSKCRAAPAGAAVLGGSHSVAHKGSGAKGRRARTCAALGLLAALLRRLLRCCRRRRTVPCPEQLGCRRLVGCCCLCCRRCWRWGAGAARCSCGGRRAALRRRSALPLLARALAAGGRCGVALGAHLLLLRRRGRGLRGAGRGHRSTPLTWQRQQRHHK
jgi:hypothetical protein